MRDPLLPPIADMLCLHAMSVNDGLTAIARIEHAIARIEAIAARPAPMPGPDLAFAELTARHEALRRDAQQALAELSGLIAAAEEHA